MIVLTRKIVTLEPGTLVCLNPNIRSRELKFDTFELKSQRKEEMFHPIVTVVLNILYVLQHCKFRE